jgi:hypothetical protein
MSANLAQIVDTLSALTVIEAAELSKNGVFLLPLLLLLLPLVALQLLAHLLLKRKPNST